MTAILFKILVSCIGLGVITLISLWVKVHQEKNKEQFKSYIAELVDDTGLQEGDCITITYLVSLIFGFIILPIYLIRKIVKVFKG